MRQRVHSVWLILLAGCGFTDAPTDLLERADSAGIEVVRLHRASADTVHLDVPAIRIVATGLSGAEAVRSPSQPSRAATSSRSSPTS